MTVVKESDFDGNLTRRLAALNGILIHGSDFSAVSGLARKVIQTLLPENERPNVEHFDAAILKQGEAAFRDRFAAMSLLGDRQVFMVEGVDDASLKALTEVIGFTRGGNFVVLLAESLGKSSKLRLTCEAAPSFASLAVYEEDAAALAARVRVVLGTSSLGWAEDAEALFFELVGQDRSICMQEVGKLALYCLGQSTISELDVQASCGDTAAFGTDQLIDAMLAGEIEIVDRMAASLANDSAGTRGVLNLLVLHLTKLQNFRVEIDRGVSPDQVVRDAKPMIFFKRRGSILSQLRRFNLQHLLDMQGTVAAAIFQTRKLPDLFEPIVVRALLSISRSALAGSS